MLLAELLIHERNTPDTVSNGTHGHYIYSASLFLPLTGSRVWIRTRRSPIHEMGTDPGLDSSTVQPGATLYAHQRAAESRAACQRYRSRWCTVNRVVALRGRALGKGGGKQPLEQAIASALQPAGQECDITCACSNPEPYCVRTARDGAFDVEP
jgi:hypothetical protein